MIKKIFGTLFKSYNNCILGASGVTIVVVTAAGIIFIPVLYGINKRRRDLGLEPFPFFPMFQNLVKMIQSLVARANFLKDNSSHSTEEINDERIERISFGSVWEERSSNSLEFPVRLFSENETAENVGKGSESGYQLFCEKNTELKSAKSLGRSTERGNVTPVTKSRANSKRKGQDEKCRNSTSDCYEIHTQACSKRTFNKDARACRKKCVVPPTFRIQALRKREHNAQVVIDVRDWGEDGSANAKGVCVQVNLEKENGERKVQNITENDGERVFGKNDTGEQTRKNMEDWGKGKKDLNKACRENQTCGIMGNLPEGQVSKQKGKEGCIKVKACCHENVSCCKNNAQLSLKKDNGKGTINDIEIQTQKVTSCSPATLGIELIENVPAEIPPRGKLTSNFKIPPKAVSYYDESQDNNEIEINADMLKEILGSKEENEEPNVIVSLISAYEERLQAPIERHSLSDEEDIYGRKDIQRIALTRTPSDSLCFCDDPLLPGRRRGFRRFSGHLPLIELKDNKKANQMRNTLEQAASEVSVNHAQKPATREQSKITEVLESKMEKFRRKRRNSKGNTFAADEEQETGSKLNQKSDEKGYDLQRNTTKSKRETRSGKKAAVEGNSDEKRKDAEASPKKMDGKNSDSTNTKKSKIIRFLTGKSESRNKDSPSNNKDPKDGITKASAADILKACDLRRKIANNQKPKTIKEGKSSKSCKVTRKATDPEFFSTVTATKRKTADSKDVQKKSTNMSLKDTPGTSNLVQEVGCATNVKLSAHTPMDNSDRDVLLQYDDID